MAARFSYRASFLLAPLGLLAACASIPALDYGSDDAGLDAAAHEDASVDAARPDGEVPDPDADIPDAPGLDDVAEPDDPDGGPDGGIACGDASVPNYAQCAGRHLRCTTKTSDRCVNECDSCGAGRLPCFHCPPNGGPERGRCVQPHAKGRIACTNVNRCKCATAIDCPAVMGAAQTCVVAPDAGAGDAAAAHACFTCGEAQSANAPCTRLDSTMGTCRVTVNGPACE